LFILNSGELLGSEDLTAGSYVRISPPINFLINNYLSSLRGRGFRADRSILPQSVGMSQLISYPLSNRCFGRVGRRDRVAQFIQKFDARLQVLIFSQEKPSKLFNRLGATILHGYF
jgi:hypothetical protein